MVDLDLHLRACCDFINAMWDTQEYNPTAVLVITINQQGVGVHAQNCQENTYTAYDATSWYFICLLLISMLWYRQAILESKGDKLSSSAECKIQSWEVSDTNSPADWMPTHKPTELSRIELKTWTQQPVPMMSEHSAHLNSLSIGFRTWLWRYTCLLLLNLLGGGYIQVLMNQTFSINPSESEFTWALLTL